MLLLNTDRQTLEAIKEPNEGGLLISVIFMQNFKCSQIY